MRLVGIGIVLLLLARVLVFAADLPLKRLQSKVNVDSVSGETFQQFAGDYSHPSKELVGTSLSEEYLYLFPDRTYIYCEWSDVEPVTVRDKGTWKLREGLIVLQSDQEIRWDPGAEREYVAVQRAHHQSEILLIGTKDALTYFEKNAADEPGIELLVVAMKRSRRFSGETASRVKTALMRESWRPDYFRDAGQIRH